MTKKSNKGRPTKLTEKTVRLIEACLQGGASITQTCYEAGISRETFHRWLRESPEFSDRVKQAPDHLVKIAKRNILNAVIAGDIKTSQWVIEKYADEHFSSVSMNEFEVASTDGKRSYNGQDAEYYVQIAIAEANQWFMSNKYVSREDAMRMMRSNLRDHSQGEKAEDDEIWSKIDARTILERLKAIS